MDLSSDYLGFRLENPLMVGASPIVDDLEAVLRCADAGASAIVMHSLYEEQLTAQQMAYVQDVDSHGDSFAEALSIRPTTPRLEYALGPSEYLEQLRRIKARVSVPVIGSLNGATDHGWLSYARQIEQAGADALELNVYYLAIDPTVSGAEVEENLVRMVGIVSASVQIPIAVKLSPFYSSIPHLVQRLVAAGARGVVLFNRFYEPDIDVEQLALEPKLALSTSSELLMRLRWLAALSDRTPASLAVSGGVHNALGALKAVMAGAHAVQLVSVLLEQGPEALRPLRSDLAHWLETHEYESLRQAQGSMNMQRCPDPTFYQRGNYLRILQSWGRTHR